MKIRLYKTPTKFNPAEIKSAATFFGEMLMGTRLCDNLDLKIRFSKNEGNTAIWEDDARRHREFTITLEDFRGYTYMLHSLAHEMVHVKQYARGELRDYDDGVDTYSWLGEKRDWSDVDYWDLPWEIEAHGRERGLYFRYREMKR